MVGVPGKSKGCHTCKKRKIRCDQTRPVCGQCTTSKRECGGYQKTTTFLNHNSSDAATNPSFATPSAAKRNHKAAQSFTMVSVPQEASREPSLATSVTTLAHITGLNSRNAYREFFVGSFIQTYLPQLRTGSSHESEPPICWVEQVAKMANLGDALTAALTALSVGRFGRLQNDSKLTHEAMILYGKAIRELQKALWDEKLMYDEKTLAASMALALYEFGECGAGNVKNWMALSEGTGQLIELRGPRRYSSPLAHILYQDFRYTGLIQGLIRRKRSFLSGSTWLSEPWNKHEKSVKQQLFDAVVELPAIAEEAERIKTLSDPNEINSARLQLLKECWALHHRMQTWYTDVFYGSSTPTYTVQPSTIYTATDASEPGPVFPITFSYPSLEIAHTQTLYWAFSIILFSNLTLSTRALYASATLTLSTSTHPSPCPFSTRASPTAPCYCHAHARTTLCRLAAFTPLTTWATLLTHQTLADNIVRSVEYFLHKPMGILSAQAAFFPLRTAMESYKFARADRKWAWCADMCAILTGQMGLLMVPRIVELTWDGPVGDLSLDTQVGERGNKK